MIGMVDQAYVETVRERCRTCYTCVRECPAKAIRIHDGQAEVLPNRCIACGNCIRVCSQGAKRAVTTLRHVEHLLDDPKRRVALCIAPSFPAEFEDVDLARLPGAMRNLGFSTVVQVAFGADLVAERYSELLSGPDDRRWIATSCPAIVRFVEKHHPEVVENLAPIVSPMIAASRALRADHGDELAVVFVGPCIAKKIEAASPGVAGDIDAVITFRELRELMSSRKIRVADAAPSDFDPPHPNLGALFPISRGMLQAAGLDEDLRDGDIVAADGRAEFVEAIREFESGTLDARLLEVLCCTGCIMGAGMTSKAPLFRRRAKVSQFVRDALSSHDKRRWHEDVRRFGALDLRRNYEADDQRLPNPPAADLRAILARMGKHEIGDELDCGACGYETCREHAIAIWRGLAENEMCLPYTIETLHRAVNDLESSHQQLASTQEALMQSEKLASMGQLAAGIAHEVNNPLGVVLMYAHLLQEEVEENSDLRRDLSLIAEQADRCKSIVAGLLDFARQNRVLHQETNACDLVGRALRSVPAPKNVELEQHCETSDLTFEVDPDQVLQVLTNLISNAYAAMPDGGVLTTRVAEDEDDVVFEISDSGTGIPEENRKKIFEPFFTTKKIGKGTGLGLSVAYGVVKMHRGRITVESNDDPAQGPTGSTFRVFLPRQGRME